MRATSIERDTQRPQVALPANSGPTGSSTQEISMFSVIYWMLFMAASVGLLTIISSGRGIIPAHGLVHLAVGLATGVLFAIVMVRDIRRTIVAGGSRNLVGAAKVRAIGAMWVWGALCLFATYGTGVLAWAHWWKFTLPFVMIGTACLMCSVFLKRSDEQGTTDEGLLTALSWLARVQLLAMLAVMISLGMSGRLLRSLDPGAVDWAAFNILFCGAAVIGALSFFAVSSRGQAKA